MRTLLIKKKAKILFCFITLCSFAMFMDAYAQVSYGQAPSSPTQTLSGQGVPSTATANRSFVEDLSKQMNCKPLPGVTCEATVNTAVEFLTFLKHCSELKGWLIHFKPSTLMQATIVGGAESGCNISMDDNQIKDQPRNIICKITQEQLQQMTSDSSMKAVQAYDKDHNNNTTADFRTAAKPILDCTGPPRKVTEFKEIPH